VKVTTVEEIQKIDRNLLPSVAAEAVAEVGRGVSDLIMEYLYRNQILNHVGYILLLVGKGNKGADAFAAGASLLERGFLVTAARILEEKEFSPLCQQYAHKFREAGGSVVPFSQELFADAILVVDGLLGTGFKGAPSDLFAQAIICANHSALPIVAIDIPSGLNGTTGEVATVAIKASVTCYVACAKLGFFIGSGWNHVGELVEIPLSIDLSSIKEEALLAGSCSIHLPPPVRNRHKYERGYLLALAGSCGMSGAAHLTTLSALRSGSGIVRLFHEPELAPFFPFPELLTEGWNLERILEEAKRATALLIGPGMGRSQTACALLKALLPRCSLPMVIDGDALFFLGEHPEWKIPQGSILTPHHGEAKRLFQASNATDQKLLQMAQVYVDHKEQILLLKGAPSFLFAKGIKPLVLMRGDPGMATAGSGDILTGVIGSLLSQGVTSYDAALFGATLHGIAGEDAARRISSYNVIASDLIDSLPYAFLYTNKLKTWS